MSDPRVILLFSGKRKSGKDYICERIKSILGGKGTIVRISGPLKGLYAKNHNLDFEELLSDGPYKENHRRDMIDWSDKIRESEPGYFCRAACKEALVKSVWIVSDIRRKTDIEWFQNEYPNKISTVRVEADLHTRESRGWKFTTGVDDVASECNLDDFGSWDLKITNNVESDLQTSLEEITNLINSVIM